MKSLSCSCLPHWVCHFLRAKLVVNIGLVLVLAGIQQNRVSHWQSQHLFIWKSVHSTQERLIPPQTAKPELWSVDEGRHFLSLCSIEGDHSKAPQLPPCKTLHTECGWALPSQIILGVPAELEAAQRELSVQLSRVPRQGCEGRHFAEKGAGFPQLQLCALTSCLAPTSPQSFKY